MRVEVIVPKNGHKGFTSPVDLQVDINNWIKTREQRLIIEDVKYQTFHINGMPFFTAMILFNFK